MTCYVTDLSPATKLRCKYCGKKATNSWRNSKAPGRKFLACDDCRGRANGDSAYAHKEQ